MINQELGEIALAVLEIMQKVKEGKIDPSATLARLRRIAEEERSIPKGEIDLSELDQKILIYLQEKAEQTCTFEELMQAGWGRSITKERKENDRKLISIVAVRLREKIEGRNLGSIEAVEGKGYCFIPINS